MLNYLPQSKKFHSIVLLYRNGDGYVSHLLKYLQSRCSTSCLSSSRVYVSVLCPRSPIIFFSVSDCATSEVLLPAMQHLPCPGVFLAPDTPVLPLFKFPPDDQVPAVKSFIVSLKVFVVELKYNCPSCI